MAGFGTELYWFNGPTGVTNQGSLGNGTYNGGMGVVSDTDSGGTLAFEFSAASSQFISLPTPTNLTTGSIGVWLRTSTTGSMALYSETETSSGDRADVYIGGNLTGFYADESSALAVVDGAATKNAVFTRDGTDAYQSGSWLHYVVTVENAARKVYVNGVLKTGFEPFTPTNDFFTNVAGVDSVSIGKRGFAGSPLYYTGKLDDLRVLSSVLSATDVSDWYTGGRGYNPVTANPAAILQINSQSARVGL